MMTGQERKILRGPYVRELFRTNRLSLCITIVAAMLGALGSLLISWLIKELVDLISGSSKYSISTLLAVVSVGIGGLLLGGLLDYIFLSRFRAKAMAQYRSFAFERLLQKGIHAFSDENTALYISALSNDVNTIETALIQPLQSVIQTAFTFVGALVLMLIYSPLLTLVSIGFSLLPIVNSVILGNRAAKAERDLSNRKEAYTGTLKDVLTGFAPIKSFKAERSISGVYAEKNDAVKLASQKRTQVKVLVSYSSSLAGGIVQLGVFFVAAALALSGKDITGGVAIVFVQLMNYILSPIQVFSDYYAGAKSSFALIDKLAQAISQNVVDQGEYIEPQIRKRIALHNVSFSYETDKPVLNKLSMEFPAGGCYAVVGSSGSGKSTILNLLMASSLAYQGEILYDDKELKTISTNSLYDLSSIIQQNVFIFNSTIRNNITMFSTFPQEEVERAVKLSGLKALLDERGEDYLCGENGSGLSGGERQRISIARALLRKTPVLLVDEATAALDAATAFEVLNAILKLDGYTRVIVTHDLDENVLRRCSRLFVLKNGAVSEQGSFDELMNQRGYFYSLFTVSQQ